MYTIDCAIGEGSFGKVYLTKEGVAVKSFRRLQPAVSKISCIREYDTFIKLIGCDYIVPLKNILFSNPFKDIIFDDKIEDIFFVMERCLETGDKYTRRKLEYPAKVKYALDVALGLEFMHSRGIQHNDLKSDNILMFASPNGGTPVAKLTDFGFSKIYSIQDYSNPSVYIKNLRAPEIREEKNYRFSHDIWAYSLMMLNLFIDKNITTSDIYTMTAEEQEGILGSLDDKARQLVGIGLSGNKLVRDNISDLINCEIFDDYQSFISKTRSKTGINREGVWVTKPQSIYIAPDHPDRQKFFAYTTRLREKTTNDVVMLHTQHNVDRYLNYDKQTKHSAQDIFITWNAIYFLCYKYYAIFLDEHILEPIEIGEMRCTPDLIVAIQNKEKELLHDCFRGNVICYSFPEEVNGTYPFSEKEITWLLWFLKNMKPGETQTIFEIVKLMRHLD